MKAHPILRALLLCAALTVTSASCGDGEPESSEGSASCGTNDVTIAAQQGEGASTTTTLPADDGALADAVTETFCATFVYKYPDGSTQTAPPALSSKSEAACIGSGLVRELGADRVRELDLGLGGWSLLGFGLSHHRTIQRPEAETIVDTFKECSESWKLLMIRSITEGANSISEASARCTGDRLSDTDARSIFAGELDRAYDEQPTAQPFGESVKPLLAAMEACLTPDELEALDWA
jgi:hypothetical protein